MDGLNEPLARTRDSLLERLGERITFQPVVRGELTAVVPPDELLATLQFLRDDPALDYRLLSDVTAVDRLPREPRFEVVYHLFSLSTTARLRLKIEVAETASAPSITSLWRGANFMEREVYDMFGIPFAGHPNLARILTPDEFEGYPLRRDFAIGAEQIAFDIPHRKRFSDAPI